MTGTKLWVERTNEAPKPTDEVGFLKKPPAGLHLGECGSLPHRDRASRGMFQVAAATWAEAGDE